MNSHKYLLALQNRIIQEDLDGELKNYIKGLEGENYFKMILEEHEVKNFIHDINLNIKSRVQIDFLVVTDTTIFHLEIKHYSGDYSIQDGQLLNDYGNMFYSPFQQIQRANYEISHIISHYNIKRALKSFLIFTNPQFTLKTAKPSNFNILLPTELHKLAYMFKDDYSEENSEIINIFKKENKDFSKFYNNINKVPLKHLRPGLKCPRCNKLNHMLVEDNKKTIICQSCHYRGDRQYVYLYNLKELYICKKEPFTLDDAQKWCGVSNNLTIRRVLDKYFKSYNKKPKIYYLSNE
ncbi:MULTISPECIES: nuclease-related domain-containing protein [Mammaliicoccus]|nr:MULTISPECIES: nuclease-related domain-containing protein [Mammaliicoccus]PTI37846.1 NERD domain-containing protein [Mammaliicoccus vitulinus]PTI73021.1 NERD domain-containing protein [Mammaliicoccus vitulinus]HAL09442.1 NERD domain-containing protein [Staphylococcus sp.]